jgi:hypothetical protein
MENASELLMLRGVVASCADCAVEQVLVPADDDGRETGVYCCTVCDAAVFLLDIPVPMGERVSRSAA